MNVRTELRRAPTWWVLAAVVVALVVLTAKGAGLVILATVMLVERLVAVVLVVLTWVDGHPAIVPDRRGRHPGRGAWLHPALRCLDRVVVRAEEASDLSLIDRR